MIRRLICRLTAHDWEVLYYSGRPPTRKLEHCRRCRATQAVVYPMPRRAAADCRADATGTDLFVPKEWAKR